MQDPSLQSGHSSSSSAVGQLRRNHGLFSNHPERLSCCSHGGGSSEHRTEGPLIRAFIPEGQTDRQKDAVYGSSSGSEETWHGQKHQGHMVSPVSRARRKWSEAEGSF